MAQLLTKTGVRKAVKATMKRGKLGAQTKKRQGGRYLYDDGRKCAIGCALDRKTLKAVLASEASTGDYYTVDQLIERGFVKPHTHYVQVWLQELQHAHDDWVSTDPSDQAARHNFLDVLNS